MPSVIVCLCIIHIAAAYLMPADSNIDLFGDDEFDHIEPPIAHGTAPVDELMELAEAIASEDVGPPIASAFCERDLQELDDMCGPHADAGGVLESAPATPQFHQRSEDLMKHARAGRRLVRTRRKHWKIESCGKPMIERLS